MITNIPNQNAQLSDAVLYYPTIEFQDDVWLKNALLVWEKIYRIVPPTYDPVDSEDVERAVDAGCIEQINLSDLDLDETAQKFEEFCDGLPFSPAALEGWDDSEIRLHPDKVDARIRPILESLARKIDLDGWLRLSPEIANSYMLFLSETISRRRQIPKLTDNADMFAIMHYFANDGNIDEFIYHDEAKEVSSTLVLETILPDGIDAMPMRDLLKFREQFKNYRQDFRSSIMTLSQQVSQIRDKEFAQEAIARYQRSLEVTRKDLFKAMSKSGRNIVSAALSIGLPTALTAIGALAIGSTDPFSFSQVGASGLIGATAAIAQFRQSRREQWTSNESTYYMQLWGFARSGEKISVRVPDFKYALNEFIND